MSRPFTDSPPYALDDAWTPEPIPLDGPVEKAVASRRGVAARSLVAGILGLLVAFIAFQLFISPAATVMLLLLEGVEFSTLDGANAITQLLETNVQQLIIGNSVGQVLGLGALAVLFTRLHTTALGRYLRLRRPDGALIGLALVGLVALMPIVQWLGAVNQSIPLPDWIQAMEQSQMELIEQVLSGGLGVTFNLLMLAVVPAICEELLFRGYAQRQFERGMGIAGGILASGKFKEKPNWLNAITYEHINTKQQDSKSWELIGSADYYDNGTYSHGWTYENSTVGIPLILFKNNDISNNVLVAHHLGIGGNPNERLNYEAFFTYSRNYGIQDDWVENPGNNIPKDRADVTPYGEFRQDQYSWLLRFVYDVQSVDELAINLEMSGDFGEQYEDRLGIMVGATWSNVF